MAKEIMPPLAYLRECFDYNPKTGELTWKERPLEHFLWAAESHCKTWNSRYAGKRAGAISGIGKGRRDPYRYLCVNAGKFLEHRIIWLLINGQEPPGEIDHINRMTTDNRWNNLRVVTRQTNSQNRGGVRNRDLPPGVSRQTNCKNYRAAISINGKAIHLGSFATPEEARRAYLKGKKRFHVMPAALSKRSAPYSKA